MKNTILIISILVSMSAYSQDIIINFSAEGVSTEIDYVKIENITQNKEITTTENSINLSIATKITDYQQNKNSINIYPNPFMDKANIEFYSNKKQKINITILDITGKILVNENKNIEQGTQIYNFRAGKTGIYFILISGNDFKFNEKIISMELFSGETRFTSFESNQNTKQAKNIFYEIGDQLIFTAYSSDYSSIISSSPTISNDYIFEFVECQDFDQNNYPTIKIGDQIWMAENLKSEYYANGNSIDGDYFYDNNSSNKDIYGSLYTWAAVMNGATGNNNNPSGVQGVCPNGWHVPSEEEWDEMREELGGWQLMHGRVKEVGTMHWDSPNSDATNESGLSFLPAGMRWGSDGTYQNLGELAHFWTTTDTDDLDNAGGYRFFSELPSAQEYMQTFDSKNHAKSIRCVKN